MRKFIIGDRVRLLTMEGCMRGLDMFYKVGDIGTVVNYDDFFGVFCVDVLFDKDYDKYKIIREDCFMTIAEDEIEMVEEE